MMSACPGPGPSEPPLLASRSGRLEVALDARISPTCVDGLGRPPDAAAVMLALWNGTLVPPTLLVEPGDHLVVRLANGLGRPTNLHFHGLHVAPTPPGDASGVEVADGDVYTYEVAVPPDHPRGLFWYHAHPMHTAQWQVYNGLSGALAVGRLADAVPELAGIPERVLCLRDMYVDAATGEVPFPFVAPWLHLVRLVNGRDRPDYRLAAGAAEIWRIANVGAEIAYNLTWAAAAAAHPGLGTNMREKARHGSESWRTHELGSWRTHENAGV